MKKTIFNSKSEEETKDIALSLVKIVLDYKVICLYGELGSGKTTFVKFLGKALGVNNRIVSPTYIFFRKYKSQNNYNFYHIDAYRIKNTNDDKRIIKEILEDDNAIIVMEWAERVKEILPEKRLSIKFNYKDEKDTREITVIKHSS